MSNDHYYSSNPSIESNRQSWRFPLRGHDFLFTVDNGVFSKKEVDFGSRLLIDEFVWPEDVAGGLVDVGCGYGPIGLSIAKTHPDKEIEMIDVNERALELARFNAQQNGVANVNIHQSFLFDDVQMERPAVVLSNPPIRAGKQVVHGVFEQSAERLASGGELWIVIQKKQGAPSALLKFEELFAEVEVVAKKKGYYIIKGKKR